MSDALTALIEDVRAQDARAIARAISLVENDGGPALALLQRLFPHTGRAVILGVTGSPGVGKSTLVDRLAQYYRARGETVGILAVDPSSPFTGGAILGDRIRMQTLGTDPGVFIRSMATRGNLGGLARATGDAVLILDAAGYEKVIIETVGVGQDEVDIAKTADVTIVVLMPGLGDDVQTIKAGLMEIADLFVINKADREGVGRLESELNAMLALAERGDGWRPPIIKTIATEGYGIEDLGHAIARFLDFRERSPHADRRRQEMAEQRLRTLLRDQLFAFALRHLTTDEELAQWAAAVARRERDPYSIVEEVLRRWEMRGPATARPTDQEG
jgi:LAO/AO transport system kinase